MADSNKGQRGVTRPGYQVGSSKTSPVPGRSRTQAAIKSLTAKGRADNQGRIEAALDDSTVRRLNPQGKTMGQISSEVAKRTSGLQGRPVGGMDHQGGHGLDQGEHTDASTAINLGGMQLKTPIVKKGSSTNK